MKTLGIIGGIGPESTIDYYRSIVGEYRKRAGDRNYPSIIINSVDLTRLLSLAASKAFPELTSFLVEEIEKLANAGADLALLSSNTPHLVFDEVAERSPLPLLSIVRVTRDAAAAAGVKRAALIGTRFTMEGGFYQKAFSETGIELVVPKPDEQTLIHDRYMNELVGGIFLPATRERILAILQTMKTRDAVSAVVLAGTEIPLLLRGHEPSGTTFLDTTQIHVQAAVDEMLSDP